MTSAMDARFAVSPSKQASRSLLNDAGHDEGISGRRPSWTTAMPAWNWCIPAKGTEGVPRRARRSSQHTTPKLYTSAFSVYLVLARHSGAIHWNVPRFAVIVAVALTRARPKSASFTTNAASKRRFPD